MELKDINANIEYDTAYKIMLMRTGADPGEILRRYKEDYEKQTRKKQGRRKFAKGVNVSKYKFNGNEIITRKERTI